MAAGKKEDSEFGHCADRDATAINIEYMLRVDAEGIIFSIPVTQNGSCGERVIISYNDLMPFLNNYGKQRVSELVKKSQ